VVVVAVLVVDTVSVSVTLHLIGQQWNKGDWQEEEKPGTKDAET
jgi:hypothetical protein